MLIKLQITCLLLFLIYSQSPGQARKLINPSPSKEAQALYCYIQSISGKKTLSGQMWSGWGFDELAYIQTNTGKQPAVMGVDFIQESVNNTQVTLATNWWKKGGIPTVMWHWGAPGKGEGYDASQLTIDINRCFTPGTAEYTAFWAELTKKADHLQALRDANVPVLWRPFHELNGGWFWWGKGGGAQFQKLWTTMYDYFVNTRKLNNLIWVLCYTGSPDGSFFPGNQYVDIAGGDEYATTNDPQQALYNNVKKSIGGNNMPITLHECGIPPDPSQTVSKSCVWSWWMVWHTTYIQDLDKNYLKTLYNHDVVLTLDELPNIMSQPCGTVTEVEGPSETNQISVYPIPCKDALNIYIPDSFEASVSTINVYSVDGILVAEETSQHNVNFVLNTAHLQPGMYFIKVRNNNSESTEKFIKTID